jgi:hypothetical protein
MVVLQNAAVRAAEWRARKRIAQCGRIAMIGALLGACEPGGIAPTDEIGDAPGSSASQPAPSDRVQTQPPYPASPPTPSAAAPPTWDGEGTLRPAADASDPRGVRLRVPDRFSHVVVGHLGPAGRPVVECVSQVADPLRAVRASGRAAAEVR